MAMKVVDVFAFPSCAARFTAIGPAYENSLVRERESPRVPCRKYSRGGTIELAGETPLNNLWVSMLNRMGVDVHKVGDSSGALPGLL
jgi:hypothetical protein